MFYLFWRVYVYGNISSVLQMLCMEREINRLDEVYQQLSSELHRPTHIRSPPEKKEPRFDKTLQVTASVTHLMETPIQPSLYLQEGQINLHCQMYFSPLLSVYLTLPMLAGAAGDAGAAEVYCGSETEGDERQTF